MLVLVTNRDENRLDTLTHLYVNRAYKGENKENCLFGIFNNDKDTNLDKAYALYATKARAEEVVREIIASLEKPQFDTTKILKETLANGFKKYEENKTLKQVLIIRFPKE